MTGATLLRKRLRALAVPSLAALAAAPGQAQASLRIVNPTSGPWTLVVLQAPAAWACRVGTEAEIAAFLENLPIDGAGEAKDRVALDPGKILAIPSRQGLLLHWGASGMDREEATFRLWDPTFVHRGLTFRFQWQARAGAGAAEPAVARLELAGPDAGAGSPEAVCAWPGSGPFRIGIPSYRSLPLAPTGAAYAAIFGPPSSAGPSRADEEATAGNEEIDGMANVLDGIRLGGKPGAPAGAGAGVERKSLPGPASGITRQGTGSSSGLPTGPAPSRRRIEYDKALLDTEAMWALVGAGTAADAGPGAGGTAAARGSGTLPALTAGTARVLDSTTAGAARLLDQTAAGSVEPAAQSPFSQFRDGAMDTLEDGGEYPAAGAGRAQKRDRDESDDEQDFEPRKRQKSQGGAGGEAMGKPGPTPVTCRPGDIDE